MNIGEYSLYRNTEYDSFYKSYYEPICIEKDSTDMFVVITNEYHLKPGKMAKDLYGSEKLCWIFSLFNRNNISDIIFDFTAGKIIRVPIKERLLSYF